MRLPGSTGVARIAPLMAAFFLCLGAFLYPHQPAQHTAGPTDFTVLKMERSSRAGTGSPGSSGSLAGNYLAVSVEETESANRSPVNAGYLTALLLTVFFGVVLGLLVGGRTGRRERGLLLAGRRLPPVILSPPRELSPSLLSVFIL